MNGNARGAGHQGSGYGSGNGGSGGNNFSAPKEAYLDYVPEETEYKPNLSNYYNGANALSFFPADNTSTCTNCLLGISSAKDFQIFFDLAGIIHPAGDVLSAGISFENGDYVDGLLSLAAIIPIAGDLAKYGGKFGKISSKIDAFLGKETKVLYNEAGDVYFQSKNGMKEIRFDFNNFSPHIHIIEYTRVKNKKIELINKRIFFDK